MKGPNGGAGEQVAIGWKFEQRVPTDMLEPYQLKRIDETDK